MIVLFKWGLVTFKYGPDIHRPQPNVAFDIDRQQNSCLVRYLQQQDLLSPQKKSPATSNIHIINLYNYKDIKACLLGYPWPPTALDIQIDKL